MIASDRRTRLCVAPEDMDVKGAHVEEDFLTSANMSEYHSRNNPTHRDFTEKLQIKFYRCTQPNNVTSHPLRPLIVLSDEHETKSLSL